MAAYTSEYNVKAGRIMPKRLGGKSYFKKPRRGGRRSSKGWPFDTGSTTWTLDDFFEERYAVIESLIGEALYNNYKRAIKKAKKDFYVKFPVGCIFLSISFFILSHSIEIKGTMEYFLIALYAICAFLGMFFLIFSFFALHYSTKRAKEYTLHLYMQEGVSPFSQTHRKLFFWLLHIVFLVFIGYYFYER